MSGNIKYTRSIGNAIARVLDMIDEKGDYYEKLKSIEDYIEIKGFSMDFLYVLIC